MERSRIPLISSASLREKLPMLIVDETNVDLFSRMIGEGWSMPVPPLERFNRHILRVPNRRHHMFLAFEGDECAGAANMVLLERSMLLQGGVVLPRFRRRGIYRALVDARMRFAAVRGHTLATVHANPEMSAPILLKNGFEEICAFSKFFNR